MIELAAVDSLQRVADSLEALRLEALVRSEALADSLRRVAEQELFGESSRLVEVAHEAAEGATISQGFAWGDLLVMLLLGLYVVWLSGFVGDVNSHSKERTYGPSQSVDNADGGSARGALQRYVGGHLLTYLLVAMTMTLLLSNLLLCRSLEGMWWIFVGCHLLFVVEALLVGVSSYLSYDDDLFGDTMKLKVQYWIVSMIWVLPILLVVELATDLQAILYLSVIQSIVVLGGYIFTSFRLFASKKISILNWFLYLCAVEMLPKVLLWTFLTRNLSAI